TARRSWARAGSTWSSHRSIRPRWKRTVAACGNRLASGPSRPKASAGRAFVKRPTAAATRACGSSGAVAAAASNRFSAEPERPVRPVRVALAHARLERGQRSEDRPRLRPLAGGVEPGGLPQPLRLEIGAHAQVEDERRRARLALRARRRRRLLAHVRARGE